MPGSNIERSRLIAFDREHIGNHRALIGVDEAGRGPLAGPVVAAAVLIDASFYQNKAYAQACAKINDSKQISSENREAIFAQIKTWQEQQCIQTAWALCNIEEIETHNIYGATRVAMEKALHSLQDQVGVSFVSRGPILVDGRPFKQMAFAHEGVIKGDGKSLAIAMASIIAKVSRDRIMIELHSKYPCYGFDRHKGYPTLKHREAILKHGPCPEHRPRFLRKILESDPNHSSG